MTRTIITFETIFLVLAADKLLKEKVSCRTVPTPSGLSSDICGISIELLEPEKETDALALLESGALRPRGVFHV
jgi:hypothetical protein